MTIAATPRPLAGGGDTGLLRRVDAALRAFAAAAIAGVVAGMLTGGVLGRIAMRVTALTAGDADQGRLTDAEEIVGVISFDGTFGLIIFVGIFSGFFGGLLYAGARPWLAGLGRWRGLAFGVLLFASVGWLVVEHENFDFHRFGYATLNIAMYAGIFIAFGLVVAPVFEWMVRRLPDLTVSMPGLGGLAARAFGLLGLFGSLGIGVGAGSEIGGAWGIIPAFLLVASVVAVVLLSTREGGVVRPADRIGAPVAYATAVALLVAVALGAWLDARAIVHHLTA